MNYAIEILEEHREILNDEIHTLSGREQKESIKRLGDVCNALEKLNVNTEKRVANCRHPSWAQSFNGAVNKRHCSICGKYFT